MPIRPAQPSEGPALTALSIRSKAHWGYDATFMAQAAPHLAIPADLLATGRVWVSTVVTPIPTKDASPQTPAAVMALSAPDSQGTAELVLLFVDPPHMGKGHGKSLLHHALALARSEGARCLRVLSDPQAEAFYRARGAIRTAIAPSDAIPGRWLPVLEWRLP